MVPGLLVFLAATGQPRSYTRQGHRRRGFYNVSPFPSFVRSIANEPAADTCPTRQTTTLPTSRTSSIPPSPHTHTWTAMSPPHHGQGIQRSWIGARPRRTRARQCLASMSKSVTLCLGPLGQRCHCGHCLRFPHDAIVSFREVT